MSGKRVSIAAALGIAVVVAGLAIEHGSVRPLNQRVDPEENEATRVTANGRCGAERWVVKTLRDPAADSVDLVPKPATVAGMNALPAPTLPDDNTTRLPSERQAFRVTALLVGYKLEPDQDIHLVLAEGGKTMIAEMPSVHCDAGSRDRYAMFVARTKLEAEHGPATTDWTYVRHRVTVTGVRFFDFKHGQTGVADNAVELHPVIGFKP